MKVIYHYENAWERDWLDYFLDEDVEHIVDLDRAIRTDNAIYVSKLRNEADFDFMSALRNKRSVALFHAGDENYLAHYKFYNSFNAVIRNYHCPWLAEDGIFQWPLFLPKVFHNLGATRPATERLHVWGFIGRTSVSDRADMAKTLSDASLGFLIANSAWADMSTLSHADYADLMQQFVFVPCPVGLHLPETVRLYEALEAGCVPIAQNSKQGDYIRGLFGDVPFPVVNSWSEGADIVRRHQQDAASVLTQQAACQDWWTAKKEQLRAEFAAFRDRMAHGPKVAMSRFAPVRTRLFGGARIADNWSLGLLRRLREELSGRPMFAEPYRF